MFKYMNSDSSYDIIKCSSARRLCIRNVFIVIVIGNTFCLLIGSKIYVSFIFNIQNAPI